MFPFALTVEPAYRTLINRSSSIIIEVTLTISRQVYTVSNHITIYIPIVKIKNIKKINNIYHLTARDVQNEVERSRHQRQPKRRPADVQPKQRDADPTALSRAACQAPSPETRPNRQGSVSPVQDWTTRPAADTQRPPSRPPPRPRTISISPPPAWSSWASQTGSSRD